MARRSFVDARAAQAVAADLAAAIPRVRSRARPLRRAVSLRVEREVKLTMPVDSGRARASWGHWSPGTMTRENADASPAEAIWEDTDDSTTQGTSVPYVERLNAGHSQQAPAGFLDQAWLRGEHELEVALTAMLAQETGGRGSLRNRGPRQRPGGGGSGGDDVAAGG